jgi:hypothetical protein
MDRRTSLKVLVAAAAAVPAIGGTTSMFRNILEASMNEKKGLMLYSLGLVNHRGNPQAYESV